MTRRDPTPGGDDWLATWRRATLDSVARLLNIDVGLSEVLLGGVHESVGGVIAEGLNVDAGLQAALRRASTSPSLVEVSAGHEVGSALLPAAQIDHAALCSGSGI